VLRAGQLHSHLVRHLKSFTTTSKIGSIYLPLSFGSLRNARTEHITFDVVDMHYPYNTIFGRRLLNTFEAALHSVYLWLKVPTALWVTSIHGNQKEARKKEARKKEQGFTPGHRNVNCLQHRKQKAAAI
jgi:hypothetical protein